VVIEEYGMRCELVSNSADHCQMNSPRNVPNATVPTPCMTVKYLLSSDDVRLTADILVADSNVISGVTFQRDRTINSIRLSGLPSMYFSVTFTAERILTSVDTTQFARIEQVQLGLCEGK